VLTNALLLKRWKMTGDRPADRRQLQLDMDQRDPVGRVRT
jgi:hypothetical protein